MTLEQAIHAALVGDPAVSGLVGDRVFLVRLPQLSILNNGPAITYQRISTVPIYTHSFDVGQQGTVGFSRFQFTVWGGTTDSSGELCETISNALLAVFKNFNAQEFGQSPVIQSPNFLLSRRMESEGNVNPPLFKELLDLKIWYRDQ
jgi:uncharacterized protein DUF3168